MKTTNNRAGFAFINRLACLCLLLAANQMLWDSAHAVEPNLNQAMERVRTFDFESLGLAITDLSQTFGPRYPNGRDYIDRLDRLEQSCKAASAKGNALNLARELETFRSQALLGNPLLDFERLLLLKRKRGQLGLPVNHKCNAGINRTGYDNEIAILSNVRGGALDTLFKPTGRRFVGEIDLDFDAEKLLFTMPKGPTWQIFEMNADGSGLREVSRSPDQDVDNFDGCYLPDGRIVFASTASFHAVPCWHGKERACSLYLMDGDGSNVRQLCFDQDLDLHPSVLPSGQIIFSRWDYAGPMHIYLRPLMAMNPDGTGQRAIYGSNSYWPNALYYPRGIPGAPNKIIAIVAGYHGVPRMGELALLDLSKGSQEADGVVQRIPGRGKPVKPIIRDNLVDKSWPKFLHPYPLSDKYFLVACQPSAKSPWGIYLVDVFDNVLPICTDSRFDFFEPIPLRKTPRPFGIPDRVDLSRDDAIVYLHDVYAGPGLAGVPRGAVKKLRIVAYHFGYPGLAGPDKIGCGGPWEAMRIIGTVPVHKDGSAMFRAPANTPLCVQPLDERGRAVQLMRSWFTAMPGEKVSCVGCHERPDEIPAARYAAAANRPPDEIEPWFGPPRGFDFEREVQPVLDKYCVGCHNPDSPNHPAKHQIADFRSERYVQNYLGRELTKLGRDRLHPESRKFLGGTAIRYTPAYEALLPYIRRVNIEDHVGLLVPGEYHADTSELIQMLEKGHHNVQLDKEAWDRLFTWIDLNGPCHGTWSDVCPIPDNAAQRRGELKQRYGGPKDDPEKSVKTAHRVIEPIIPKPMREIERQIPKLADWPFNADVARNRQKVAGAFEKTIDLGGGVKMKLVRIPAGEFLMGDTDGGMDERPVAKVSIGRDFWMGVCEVTNEQYRRFAPDHDSGLFTKRFQGPDGPGLSLAGAKQPAVRVSWSRAMAFCKWLSEKTGENFTLPTEAQWEYACRAGSQTALSYGEVTADFSPWANVADKALSVRPGPTGGLETSATAHFGKGILESAVYGSNILCDTRFDDRIVATANAASFKPNPWGLHDMHGNAAEWTQTTYKPYPYNPADLPQPGKKVVRGGSWCDRPQRCRSAFRLSYPPWQRVHNVGLRVISELTAPERAYVASPENRQQQ